jgi:serine/threonine-protein kinase
MLEGAALAAPPRAGGEQRTVMMDASAALPPAPRRAAWGRWVLGPALMVATAAATHALAGVVLPAAVVQPAPPPVALGRIDLQTHPPGASVRLDGKPHPHFTPTVLEAPVDATVRVVVAMAGYQTVERDLVFAAGTRPLELVLEKVDAPPPPPPKREHAGAAAPARKGTVAVFVKPWAKVSVDGVLVGQTPLPHVELTAGHHVIELANPKLGRRERVTVTIHPGENPEVRRDFTR